MSVKKKKSKPVTYSYNVTIKFDSCSVSVLGVIKKTKESWT